MAQRSNQSIIDKFLDEYLMEGTPSPSVLGTTAEQMRELSEEMGAPLQDPQALYVPGYQDLILQENFNPYSKSKKEGQSQREYGQHEILHYLDDLYAPDRDPEGVRSFTAPAQWGTDEFTDTLDWGNIGSMIATAYPSTEGKRFADTLSTDYGKEQEILTYLADPGSKGRYTGTGAITGGVHNVLSEDADLDVTNLVGYIADRQKVFDMFDKVTEGTMKEAGKEQFRDRDDIEVLKKWGRSTIY